MTFNTAESGALRITIKGATVADHGTETGWQNSFGVENTQAVFSASAVIPGTGIFHFTTGYWVFDGSVGTGNTMSSYGFKFTRGANCSAVTGPQDGITALRSAATQTDLTIKYVGLEMCGPSFDAAQRGILVGCAACYVTATVFANNYITGAQGSMGLLNVANSTIERNWGENHWTSPNHHSDAFAAANSDKSGGESPTCPAANECGWRNEFRYNVVKDCVGTGGMIGSSPKSFRQWKIHGNLFVNCLGGNGAIGNIGGNYAVAEAEIYNNTFASSTRIQQCSAAPGCATATGNIVKNNLFWNNNCVDIFSEGTGGAITHDYNAFFDCAQGTPPVETNGQIGTGDPFVNRPSSDHHLTAATNAGDSTIGAAYNTDPDGKTRGADGAWDRGAYEFDPAQNRYCCRN